MEKLLASTPLPDLASEVMAVPLQSIQEGSGHASSRHKGGWISGLSMLRVQDDLDSYPVLKYEIEELQKSIGNHELRQVMINRLEPGCCLEMHEDGPPDDYRYHLPVVTNPSVRWWDEVNGIRYMQAGYWYGPVAYCGRLHSMSNRGRYARVHVIADFVKDRYSPET